VLALHIGYAKAATTFLQRRAFPHLPGVHYVGRNYTESGAAGEPMRWVSDLVFADRIDIAAIADDLSRGMAAGDTVSLVSHENLWRPYEEARTLDRLRELAARFDAARIIVSIRRQPDIILSRRVHDRGIIEGGSMEAALDFAGTTSCRWPQCTHERKGLQRLRKSRCSCRAAGLKSINVPFYDYAALRQRLGGALGEDNVHILVSEGLLGNTGEELGLLTSFLGTPPPPAALLEQIAGARENIRRGQDLYGETERDFLESGKRQEVADFFSASNRALDASLPQDLAAYGYY